MAYEDIKKSIENFEPNINIRTGNPFNTLIEVFKEKPTLTFYLKSFVQTSMGFRIEYMNTDVSKELVFFVRNEEELSRVLHKVVSDSQLKIGVISEKINIQKVLDEFTSIYGLYYSNFTNWSYNSWQYDFINYSTALVQLNYRIGRVKLNMMKREVEDKIKELDKKLFAPSMTGLEIAYITHNYLARTVEYWMIDDPNPLELSYRQSAYGALINHKCVCQGYSEAFKKILNYKGIICEVVSGKIKGENIYHAWNMITINNLSHFHIDVTWDSLGGGAKRDDYFGLLDKDLTSSRMWTRPFGKVCISNVNIRNIAKERINRSRDKYIRYGVDPKYLD